MKKIDIAGQRYGRLTVLNAIETRSKSNRKRRFWLCKCDCGNQSEIETWALRGGKTNSCGCLQKESIAKVNFKHGEAKKTKEHRAWHGMKSRCYTTTDHKFSSYGGRGIKVCERWLDSYENFLADVGRAPSPNHSFERIDADADYFLENCRWTIIKGTAQTKRRSILLELNGETFNLKQWSARLGYEYKDFHKKIKYDGKSLQELAEEKSYVAGLYIQDSTRECIVCTTLKDSKYFYPGDKSNRCKTCETERKRNERKNRSHAEPDRKSMLKSTYNLTPEDYDNLVEKQKGMCAICERVGNIRNGRLHIDHCHKTGKIRGLLCHHCNIGIGHLKDDPAIVKNALNYLEKSGAI